MKTIRAALMAAILSLGITTIASAQDPQPQGQRPGRGMGVQMLLKDITLTAEQQAKVDSIVTKYGAERQALRAQADSGADRQAMMGKMRELTTKQNDEVKAVLTDDQKKVFEKNLEEMRSRQPQRPPAR